MFKAAVTGTNGKTSVVHIAYQLMSACGFRPAGLGTLGLISDEFSEPNPVLVGPCAIKELAEELEYIHEIDGLFLEAFSTSIEAGLYDNVDFDVAALTNISVDHLDYHGTNSKYVEAKLKLFEDILAPGKAAVLNLDDKIAKKIIAVCEDRSIDYMSYGVDEKASIRLISMVDGNADETAVAVEYKNKTYTAVLPFIGDIFIHDWLCALAISLVQGHEIERLITCSEHISLPPGRMEKIANENIYIDYAHNALALEAVLEILNARCNGNLHLVFGCGGDRDNGKRKTMGRIANCLADVIYITDDNPRTENAEIIRSEILEHCPRGVEIGNRQKAIQVAMNSLKKDDYLLIAGKGHEMYQEVNEVAYEYSDKETVLRFC